MFFWTLAFTSFYSNFVTAEILTRCRYSYFSNALVCEVLEFLLYQCVFLAGFHF